MRPAVTTDAIGGALADYFDRGAVPELAGHRPVGITAAGQGMSDRSLIVTLEAAGGERARIVVRVARDGGLVREQTNLGRHFEVLRALHGSGIPAPRALFYEPDPAVLGGPFFAMEFVDGYIPVPWSPAGRAWLERAADTTVADQFARILVAIHGYDRRERLASVLPPCPPGTGYAHTRVGELRSLLRRYQVEPEPVLVDALHWLSDNEPATARTTLVHGDYRTGNLVYRGDRIAAVLDWEFAALGDPMSDIGWVCCRSNRMGSDRVCYLMPRQEFYDRYTDAGGVPLDEHAIHFWEVFHQTRQALIWTTGEAAYRDGRTDDLRLARMSYSLPTLRRIVADLLDYP